MGSCFLCAYSPFFYGFFVTYLLRIPAIPVHQFLWYPFTRLVIFSISGKVNTLCISTNAYNYSNSVGQNILHVILIKLRCSEFPNKYSPSIGIKSMNMVIMSICPKLSKFFGLCRTNAFDLWVLNYYFRPTTSILLSSANNVDGDDGDWQDTSYTQILLLLQVWENNP